MLGSIFFPLLLSFDKKVFFYQHWWRLFPSIAIGAAVFITWDIYFTRMEIWGFNPAYISGYFIGNLPVEEWMFFIIIPYCSIFIYECLKAYFKDILYPAGKIIAVFFIIVSIILGFVYKDRLYTCISFSALALITSIHYIIHKQRFLGRFYMMWLIHLIPLFIVNGVLTSLPVVWYDDTENMQFRIGSVPFEDSFYSMVLLLIILTVYEGLGKKRSLNTQ